MLMPTLSDGSIPANVIRHRMPRMPQKAPPRVLKPVTYDVPPNADLVTREELVEHDRAIDPLTGLTWLVVSEDGRLALAPVTGGEFRMALTGAWASLPMFLLRPSQT